MGFELWEKLNFILKKYEYLLNLSADDKLSKRITFECLECLKKFDDLEHDYIELDDINIYFEERFNDEEINGFIIKIRNLLVDCILDKSVFSSVEFIKYFQIKEFDGKDFLFIINPFTEEYLKIKSNLYMMSLHYFPTKKIYKEIDSFREDCIGKKYFMKDKLNYLLDKFNHYLSLMEIIMANQLKIEKIFYELNLTELSKRAEYDYYMIEEDYKENENQIEELININNLSYEITSSSLSKSGIHVSDATTFYNIKNNAFSKLYLISFKFYRFLSIDDNKFYGCYYSVISESWNYWRDSSKDTLERIDLQNEEHMDLLYLNFEKNKPENLYNFTPKIFEETEEDIIIDN